VVVSTSSLTSAKAAVPGEIAVPLTCVQLLLPEVRLLLSLVLMAVPPEQPVYQAILTKALLKRFNPVGT
jgi:hypothetical protein